MALNFKPNQAPFEERTRARETSYLYPPKQVLQAVTGLGVNSPSGRPFLAVVTSKKERTMKTKTFRFLSVAGLALSALAAGAPALAHDGYFYGHGRYGRPHFAYPSQRIFFVRPPVFVRRPVVVYRPAPVYYAQPAWGTIGGAIAGAAIGSAVGDGRPGAIAAGSVIGAVVGNGLSR